MKRKLHERDSEVLRRLKARRAVTGCDADMQIGPVPMRNKKPAPKHPNAPDKWSEEHRSPHHRESGTGPCRTVNSHNNACPKLKDELETRHDTANPTVNTHQICTAGVQTDQLLQCKNCSKIESSRRRKPKNKKRYDRRPNRITKRKPKSRRKMRRALNMHSNVNVTNKRESDQNNRDSVRNSRTSVQNSKTSVQNSKDSRDSVQNSRDSVRNSKDSVQNSNESVQNSRNSVHNSRDSVRNSRDPVQNRRDSVDKRSEDTVSRYPEYPDTSPEPPLSSYHSFLSMDHEPMG